MMILKQVIFNAILGVSAVSLFACAPSSSDNQSEVMSEAKSDSIDLQINWEDNSDNEEEFIIERRVEPNIDYGTSYYVDENTTSFYDVGVQVGETYCYRVSASNNMGQSSSPEVCVDL